MSDPARHGLALHGVQRGRTAETSSVPGDGTHGAVVLVHVKFVVVESRG
ncbi:hypothetical protein [Streptomyces sp. NPDC056291]